MRKLYIVLILAALTMITSIADAGEVKLTTYYPSPYGEYKTLKTTSNTYICTDGDSKFFAGGEAFDSYYTFHFNTSKVPDGINIGGTEGRFMMIAVNMDGGNWNGMTREGDRGIIYGGRTINNPGGGFIIAPWRSAMQAGHPDADQTFLTYGYKGLRLNQYGTVCIGVNDSTTQNRSLIVGGTSGTGKFPGITIRDDATPDRIYSMYVAASRELCIGDEVAQLARIRIQNGTQQGGIFIQGQSGNVGIGDQGNISPTSSLDVDSGVGYGYKQFRLRRAFTPSGTSDSRGVTGDVAWDYNFIYIKTASGWRRATLSNF